MSLFGVGIKFDREVKANMSVLKSTTQVPLAEKIAHWQRELPVFIFAI